MWTACNIAFCDSDGQKLLKMKQKRGIAYKSFGATAICEQLRTAATGTYKKSIGISFPAEISEEIEAHNAERRPIYKSMHM